MSLALGACGSGDEGEDGGNESDSSSAEIRVWLNGADTPQDARDYLKKTFEDENPGATLTIEEQQWEGLVERLTTALSSESETPDVVEVGNTQAATFTTAGAFTDITDSSRTSVVTTCCPGSSRPARPTA
jgi:N,N'-diacetylchitobiose transport system substrate-binding protein